MRISIMIAVYKEAELLGDIIRKLSKSNYQDKEILIAVDGDVTPDIETALEPYRERIAVFYNRTRLGKVDSLNRLCSQATGNAFLFLDNDIELPDEGCGTPSRSLRHQVLPYISSYADLVPGAS